MSEQELYISRLQRVGKSLRSKSTESRSQPALFSQKLDGKQKKTFRISSRSPSQSPKLHRSPSQSPKPSRSPSEWNDKQNKAFRNSLQLSTEPLEGESYVYSTDMNFCKMDNKHMSKLLKWIPKDWIHKDCCAPKRQKNVPIKCKTVVHKRVSESDENKFVQPRITMVGKGSRVQPTKRSKVDLKPEPVSVEKKFLRPRIITVMNGSEIRPRKFIQILLNHKTAPSLDRVMVTIDCGLKLNSGSVKQLFRVDGTLITKLEDLFTAPAGLFFAFGNDKIQEESFLLTVEEMKKIQSCKKSPLDGCIASAVKLIPLKQSKSCYGSASKNSMCSTFRGSDTQLCKLLPENVSPKRSPLSSGCASPRQRLKVPELEPVSLRSKYRIGNKLGEGNFAVVKECFNRSTRHQYALKIINRNKYVGYKIPIENEVSILTQMNNHPHVIQVLDVISSSSALYLVMELVHGGNLFDFILGSTTYNEMVVSGMCYHLASALHYVHSFNIVHRDVKPENLLIKDTGNGRKILKLGDFGLASRYSLPLYTVCGTPSYMAPEIITEVGYGPRVDIWSAGVIMYLLLSGKPPFVGENLSNLFANITCGKYSLTDEPWNKISASAKDLLRTLLELDPVRRISAFEFINNSWVADDKNCKSENILPIIAPKIEKFLQSNKKPYRMPRGASIVARTALDKSSNFFVIKTLKPGNGRTSASSTSA